MDRELTRFEALCLAIETAGTQEKFGDTLGVTQSAVSQWVNRSKQIPAEYVLRAEAETGVSRHALRPDIYPRGLVDGLPYEPEEPMLDGFAPLTFTTRSTGQDTRAANADDRFLGVDRRAAGAAL